MRLSSTPVAGALYATLLYWSLLEMLLHVGAPIEVADLFVSTRPPEVERHCARAPMLFFYFISGPQMISSWLMPRHRAFLLRRRIRTRTSRAASRRSRASVYRLLLDDYHSSGRYH